LGDEQQVVEALRQSVTKAIFVATVGAPDVREAATQSNFGLHLAAERNVLT
jgi:hypothetical protein